MTFLITPPALAHIREVAHMAHVRRKFVDVHRAQGSAIPDETIKRIAQLYAVEKEARGSQPINAPLSDKSNMIKSGLVIRFSAMVMEVYAATLD